MERLDVPQAVHGGGIIWDASEDVAVAMADPLEGVCAKSVVAVAVTRVTIDCTKTVSTVIVCSWELAGVPCT